MKKDRLAVYLPKEVPTVRYRGLVTVREINHFSLFVKPVCYGCHINNIYPSKLYSVSGYNDK